MIYATSNRRHLIKETWSDRDDVKNENGIHRSDTIEEKLSLVNRFGVTINYSKPSQKEYFHIVTELAKRNPSITLSEEELLGLIADNPCGQGKQTTPIILIRKKPV